MACKCFDETIKRVNEHVKSNLAKAGTLIDEASFESSWNNGVFYLASGDFPPISLRVNYEYKKQKKSGQLAQRMTKGELSVFLAFCPLCGTQYAGKSEAV